MAEDDYEPIINDEISSWIGREDTPRPPPPTAP